MNLFQHCSVTYSSVFFFYIILYGILFQHSISLLSLLDFFNWRVPSIRLTKKKIVQKMYLKIDYNSFKKCLKALSLMGWFRYYLIQYANHDFINYVSLKGFMGYVGCKATNSMKFKDLKMKRNSTQRFETPLELLIKKVWFFFSYKFFSHVFKKWWTIIC